MNMNGKKKITKWVGLLISALLLGISINVGAKSSNSKKATSTTNNNSVTDKGNIDQKQLLDDLEKAMTEGKTLMNDVDSNGLPMIMGLDPTNPERPLKDELLEDEMADAKKLKVEEEVQQPTALTAIFIAGKRKIAIINGRIVKEGDVIDGKTIEKIYSNRVEIIDMGETIVMSLPGTKIIAEEK